MSKAKIIAIVTAVTLLVGYFLSGYLTLLLLRLDIVLYSWDTYYRYVSALCLPELAPYTTKIKMSGVLGFGLPGIIWAITVVLLLKPKPRALHGDARFAGAADLSKHGLFKPIGNGIVVGKFNGKLVRLSRQQCVILAAPTRSPYVRIGVARRGMVPGAMTRG